MSDFVECSSRPCISDAVLEGLVRAYTGHRREAFLHQDKAPPFPLALICFPGFENVPKKTELGGMHGPGAGQRQN